MIQKFMDEMGERVHRSPKKPWYAKASQGESGAAGSRTPVQTRNRSGFYMLSLLYVVGIRLAADSLPEP